MQTIAVFAAVLAVASAATIVQLPSHNSAHIESHRLGGAFSYSTSEGLGHAVVQNVASPLATTYSVSGLPVSSLNGVQYVANSNNLNGVQYVANSNHLNRVQYVANTNNLGNVAVVRTSDLSGVQSYVLPSTSLVQAGTPADTYKPIAGVSPLSNVGYLPVSSYVI